MKYLLVIVLWYLFGEAVGAYLYPVKTWKSVCVNCVLHTEKEGTHK